MIEMKTKMEIEIPHDLRDELQRRCPNDEELFSFCERLLKRELGQRATEESEARAEAPRAAVPR